MSAIKKLFGKRIRELRKRMGYTQEQLAEKIGMETPNISKMENGLHFPQLENLNKLSEIFQVEIMDLFNFGHFKSKDLLIFEIYEYIKTAEINNLELIYKFVQNIKDYN